MQYQKKQKESNWFYRFTMVLMSLLLAGLLYLINDKKQFVSMESFKDFHLSNVSQLLFWEKFFPKESDQVSANIDYHLLKENYYSNGSNYVTSLLDGVVIKVEEDELLVLCDNGVHISYGKMEDVKVKKDERILSGDILGGMNESVILRFYKNDVEISKEEALSSNEN